MNRFQTLLTISTCAATLRHAAAVSTLAEGDDATLLTVLSLRWQAFHVLRVERCRQRRVGAGGGNSNGGDGGGGGAGGGDVNGNGSGGGAMDVDDEGEDDAFEEAARFVDVRPPIGAHCAPDDDAPLADADRAEREWLAGAAADEAEDDRRTREEAEAEAGAEEAAPGHGEGGSHPAPPRVRIRSSNVSRGRGWSDPGSLMYTGIKQKLMTRIFLEAHRRDKAWPNMGDIEKNDSTAIRA